MVFIPIGRAVPTSCKATVPGWVSGDAGAHRRRWKIQTSLPYAMRRHGFDTAPRLLLPDKGGSRISGLPCFSQRDRRCPTPCGSARIPTAPRTTRMNSPARSRVAAPIFARRISAASTGNGRRIGLQLRLTSSNYSNLKKTRKKMPRRLWDFQSLLVPTGQQRNWPSATQ